MMELDECKISSSEVRKKVAKIESTGIGASNEKSSKLNVPFLYLNQSSTFSKGFASMKTDLITPSGQARFSKLAKLPQKLSL